MKHMGERASYYKNVNVNVDPDPELFSHGLFGWTSYDGKTVVFYGNAFMNVENLSVTIAHESMHLQQVLEDGIKTDSVTLIQREKDAADFEDKWWNENGERIMKAYEDSDWL